MTAPFVDPRRARGRRRALGLAAALVASGCVAPEPPPARDGASAPSASSAAPAPRPLDAAHAARLAANPPGVTLRLATRGGRARFAEGEPIELELAFSSTLAGAYELDLGTYDRSGRLWSETFHVDPAGDAVDPLADYFGEMRGGFGGIRAMPPTLAPEPRVLRATLNEWVRFAKPGRYRVHVESTRVSARRDPAAEGAAAHRELTVTSDGALDLEIVADPAFAAAELARVGGVLERGDGVDAISAARRALRFLTTAHAARAMVDDLCRPPRVADERRFDTLAGLYGAPDRAAVIAALHAALARPDCAVTEDVLDLATRLDALAARVASRAAEALARVRAPLVRALVAALPAKTAAAGPLSIHAALRAASERGVAAALGDADRAALRALLAAHLAELPDDALARVLEGGFALARDPKLAAPLRALAEEARPRGSRLRSLSDLALARLFELDPAAARALVLAELARGARTSFSGATLGLLAEKELPALDAALARALAAPESDGAALELHAETFARYATAALVKDAWAAYRAVPYFRVSLLGYLVRHDARPAADAIARLDVDSLGRLAAVAYSPAVEAALVAKLATADAERAATLLAERGTPAVERALAAHLDALTAADEARGVGRALRYALTHAASFTTPPKRLAELAARCRDDACRKELEDLAGRWGKGGAAPQLVLWTTQPEGGTTGWIGHYDVRSPRDVEARIATLPRGVSLVWQTGRDDVDAALMADVRRWAAARGIHVVR